MATVLDQIGGTLGSFSWASMGSITLVISIFLLCIIVFGGVWFFMWWKSYHIRVKIYEPYGQVSKELLEKLKEKETRDLVIKEVKFDMLRYKTTHGKYVSHKGTNFFATFMPFKKHEPISMEYLFEDGVHLMKLSRDIFIPIERPKTIVGIGENVTISVADNNKWIAWNNIMAERVNNKYQDSEAAKRATLYFVIGIVAMVLIGGFILWLIYSSTNKAYNAAEKLTTIADALTRGGSNTAPPK